MSLPQDPPGRIIRQLLVTLGLVADPGGQWPAYYSHLPDIPDDAVAVFDTAGRIHGRYHITGETSEHYGIQIRVRAARQADGYSKIASIADALDTISYYQVYLGMVAYVVVALTRTSGILSLGPEAPSTRRRNFTANFLAAIR